MQSLGGSLITTDTLENVSSGLNAGSVDGNESNSLGGSLVTTDNLDDISGGLTGMTRDGEDSNDYGIDFSF
jgi:hypothetical protein